MSSAPPWSVAGLVADGLGNFHLLSSHNALDFSDKQSSIFTIIQCARAYALPRGMLLKTIAILDSRLGNMTLCYC